MSRWGRVGGGYRRGRYGGGYYGGSGCGCGTIIAIFVVAMVIGFFVNHPWILIIIGVAVAAIFASLYIKYLRQTNPVTYQKVKNAPAQLKAKAEASSANRKQKSAQRKQLKLQNKAQEAAKKQKDKEYENVKRKAKEAQDAYKKQKTKSQDVIENTGGTKMEGQLKLGTVLTSESGNSYKVVKLLGAGGQGEVYSVEKGGNMYALKWYFKNMATKTQKRILENLITKGAPDSMFLWPQDMIEQSHNQFGYIMPLRPPEYKSIVDMMKRRAEPTFYALCRVAYYLTMGYDKLHEKGFSYRDISFGNVFLEPENGDVLICDNDNVAANSKDTAVYGTPRFMAPEIVIGKAKPSRNTDLFSLAVLLFYMFMLNHPLEGALEANIKCMDMPAMNQLYGTHPVFIFDPKDKSNAPVKGYQDNALIFWGIYPWKLKDLFLRSFTTGLKEPNRRVTEKEWLETFANMMTGIVKCGSCGAKLFFDEDKAKAGKPHTCWNCNSVANIPIAIKVGKSRVLLNSGAKLYSHNINNDYDIDTVVGTLVQNPSNPNLWGIRNDTKENWTYIKADGSQIPVASGKTAGITKDAKINFGQFIGEFEQL